MYTMSSALYPSGERSEASARQHEDPEGMCGKKRRRWDQERAGIEKKSGGRRKGIKGRKRREKCGKKERGIGRGQGGSRVRRKEEGHQRAEEEEETEKRRMIQDGRAGSQRVKELSERRKRLQDWRRRSEKETIIRESRGEKGEMRREQKVSGQREEGEGNEEARQ